MKLFFSIFLLLIIVLNLNAREIIVISFNRNKVKADEINKLLTEKFDIPETLITIKKQNKGCHKIKDAILQICINEEGNLTFPVIKKDIVKHTFNVFRK